jgi:lactate dehydrogenase-like 2-hydroxyacid dehydrogenase
MCDKVDRARKVRTYDRLANHACELPIENVVTHKLKAMTKQIIPNSRNRRTLLKSIKSWHFLRGIIDYWCLLARTDILIMTTILTKDTHGSFAK